MPHRSRTTTAAALGAALLGGGLAAAPAAAAPPARPPAARPAPAAAAGAVTLLTGDRVEVRADGGVVARPGPGRTGMTFVGQRAGRSVLVIPRDAVSLLAAGKLDQRLFRVDEILAANRARRSDAVRLIVAAPAGAAAARAAVTATPGGAARPLPAIGALAVSAGAGQAAALWRGITADTGQARQLRGGLGKVWLDGVRQVSLDKSVPQTGAPAAWAAGLDGAGVKVAVLDTGVDATHPDLAGRVAAARSFGTDTGDPGVDKVGHGTHVASTVAGSGAASQGRRKGMAPQVSLLNGKVCASEMCDESAIVEGMTWAAEQGARVVNLSLGGSDTIGEDPLEQAVNGLSARHRTLFVVAAGNSYGLGQVGSPSTADAALSVAAVDGAGQVTAFSSKGLREDGAVKPEIAAPGLDINAARSAQSPGSGPYTTMSGTSMATPHVAGAAALLAQRHPEWTGDHLKRALVAYAKPTVGTAVHAQGAGQVDVAAAVRASVLPGTASVNFPRQLWPHDDDQPVSRSVSYVNPGTAPVTLALRLDMGTADGTPAPSGMFTLAASQVTVAPGTTATVDLTARTAVEGALGDYAGTVTATAPGVSLRTPVGIQRDSERYDVTVRTLDRDGLPAVGLTLMADMAGQMFMATSRPGVDQPQLRLAKGTFAAAFISIPVDGTKPAAFMVHPAYRVSRTTTITADARITRPVVTRVPHADARDLGVVMAPTFTDRPSETALMFGDSPRPGGASMYVGQLGPKISYPHLRTMVQVTKLHPEGDGRRNRGYGYNLAWAVQGRVPTGFARTVSGDQLATVTTDIADVGLGTGAKFNMAQMGTPMMSMGVSEALPRPYVMTEYFLNDSPDLRWQSDTMEGTIAEDATMLGTMDTPRRYEPGRGYFEKWNRGVFGPAVRSDDAPVRMGQGTMSICPALLDDGAGRAGFGTLAGTVTVRRDGAELGRLDELCGQLPVPAGTARYEVDVVARMRDLAVSTETRTRYAFTQAPPAQGEVTPDAAAVRFSPALDDRNASPRGARIEVPVLVQRTGAPGRLKSVTAQVSYDDGRTWAGLELTRRGDGRYTYQAQNPAAPGFASLRAVVTDQAGNTTEQTTIRAYRIG
ncbi:serine protease [Pilimelia terevasa]|uniref:Serine protease n=1 Tax=Pilimelia terevasa TaxID=53372 RepID=A0A8J3FKG4_9ACTN|nr:S8 family serine peptidase [Pilimelia terevasa]GGK28148.1 serine protease [Pilimelia terevasa]